MNQVSKPLPFQENSRILDVKVFLEDWRTKFYRKLTPSIRSGKTSHRQQIRDEPVPVVEVPEFEGMVSMQ